MKSPPTRTPRRSDVFRDRAAIVGFGLGGAAAPITHWGFGEGVWPLAALAAGFVAASAAVALRRTGAD